MADKVECQVCKNIIPVGKENRIISSADFKGHWWCNECIDILFSDSESEENDDL